MPYVYTTMITVSWIFANASKIKKKEEKDDDDEENTITKRSLKLKISNNHHLNYLWSVK